MNGVQFTDGVDFLSERGINLVATFSLDELPNRLLSEIKKSGVEIKDYQRLVLLGHAGRSLWNNLIDKRERFESGAPIDTFSRQLVGQVVTNYWSGASVELLYPGDQPVSLQQLGKLAGWHHNSPMGVGINEEHGLWYAYRAAFLIDAPLPLLRQQQGTSPCENCLNQGCVRGCPGAALSSTEAIEIDRCSRFRIKSDSPCQDRCIARECCPVAPEKKYVREQIRYHYLQSLKVIQEYYS